MARQTFSSVRLRWLTVRMNQRASATLSAAKRCTVRSPDFCRAMVSSSAFTPSTGMASSFVTMVNSPSCTTTATSGTT